MDGLMQKRIKNLLKADDLTGLCFCGPEGRRRVSQAEINGVLGALWASGHNPEEVIARVRSFGRGRLDNFDLKPEQEHYGECVPVDTFILAAEGLPKRQSTQ